MAQRFLNGLITTYQAILSPLLGPRCRYHPTCSEYMKQAVAQYGPWRGIWLGLKRLFRCHPWAEGGHDPISCSESQKQPVKPSSLTSAKAES